MLGALNPTRPRIIHFQMCRRAMRLQDWVSGCRVQGHGVGLRDHGLGLGETLGRDKASEGVDTG